MTSPLASWPVCDSSTLWRLDKSLMCFLWLSQSIGALTLFPTKRFLGSLSLSASHGFRAFCIPLSYTWNFRCICLPSLCAWVLEGLRECDEFVEWSRAALGSWYEVVLDRAPELSSPKAQEAQESRLRLRQIHKSLHTVPSGRGAYVLTLFKEQGDGRLLLRAFDRRGRETFWLPLSRKEMASIRGKSTISPAKLVAALARKIVVEVDSITGMRHLVLPSLKGEYPTKGKSRRYASKRHQHLDQKKRTASLTPCTQPSVNLEGVSRRHELLSVRGAQDIQDERNHVGRACEFPAHSDGGPPPHRPSMPSTREMKNGHHSVRPKRSSATSLQADAKLVDDQHCQSARSHASQSLHGVKARSEGGMRWRSDSRHPEVRIPV